MVVDVRRVRPDIVQGRIAIDAAAIGPAMRAFRSVEGCWNSGLAGAGSIAPVDNTASPGGARRARIDERDQENLQRSIDRHVIGDVDAERGHRRHARSRRGIQYAAGQQQQRAATSTAPLKMILAHAPMNAQRRSRGLCSATGSTR